MKKYFFTLIFISALGWLSSSRNLFAQSATIAPGYVLIPATASAPTCLVADKGKMYFNTTDNKMYFCNGSTWVDFSSAAFALPYSGSGNSNSDLFTISNSGTGNTGFFENTTATGSVAGLKATSISTSHGIGATGGVSGLLGQVSTTTPGGYSAGVRGINNGTSGTGIGVIGYQGGSGWGVYGETPSGFGVYGLTTNGTAASTGVRGETFSTNGIGVEAKYSGSGVGIALEVDNGAIRVAGVNKAAFVHTATVANKLSANGTDIDNPLCNGDANCLLFITQKLNPSGIVYNNSPVGVYYNTIRAKWEIFNQNNTTIPTNAQFNVLVIKQ
ncbi:DUF7452 domain-containing protein [Emticicia sp. SJ17W-69]|uniref:DUF7452 domain-containing protein n=1 Tax=Emticicia sp. SJ17W-69 TaxID=3421657 RepID=UPI003EBA7DB6